VGNISRAELEPQGYLNIGGVSANRQYCPYVRDEANKNEIQMREMHKMQQVPVFPVQLKV
jgi:hypothetical protein